MWEESTKAQSPINSLNQSPRPLSRCAFRDLICVTVLLALAALVLIALRDQAVLESNFSLAGFYAACLAALSVWFITTRRCARPHALLAAHTESWHSQWLSGVLTCALLLGLVWISYYQPMKIYFWRGFDEHAVVLPASIWTPDHDRGANRPLLLMWAWVGQHLAPNRMEVFLWMAAALWFFNSVLLMAILRTVMHNGGGLLPVSAAVLLVANQGEPARFMAMCQASFYLTTLFLLLLAIWLFLRSYQTEQRWLLVASCLVLGASLLTNDGIFPLTLFAPILAWLVRRREGHSVWIWSYAWLGVVAVLAVRFIIYLATMRVSYQANLLADSLHQPAGLLKNAWLHLMPFFAYFSVFQSPGVHWPITLATVVLVLIVCWLQIRKATAQTPRRALLVALGLGVLGVVFGIVPFLHIPLVFRTHFFAAPAEAVLLASLLGLAAGFFPRRARTVLLVALIALLSGLSVSASLRSQEVAKARAPVYFEKVVRIYQQLNAVTAHYPRDTLILLILDDHIESPVGVSYTVPLIARAVLGVRALQMNYTGFCQNVRAAFAEDGVQVCFAISGGKTQLVGYDQIVAFRLSADGTVSFLQQLPQTMLPARSSASDYHPLERLQAGPPAKLRFMQYPAWADRQADILDGSEGMILGQNWGPLFPDKQSPYRWAKNNAELVVNSLSMSSREIRLGIEPVQEWLGQPCLFQVVDAQERVVAEAKLSERENLKLTVPIDPARVCVFRLRLRREDGSWAEDPDAPIFRAFSLEKSEMVSQFIEEH
jgi:hypothetical protein